MKKICQIFCTLLIVLTALFSGCQKRRSLPSMGDPDIKTVETARKVVQALDQEVVFSISYLDQNTDTYRLYDIAKKSVPLLGAFETDSDAAVALIKIYEELLSQARKYDFESWLSADIDTFSNDAMYQTGTDILAKAETIEAMLALDCYYNLLNDQEIERMTADFLEMATILAKAEAAVNGSGDAEEIHTKFDTYRSYSVTHE